MALGVVATRLLLQGFSTGLAFGAKALGEVKQSQRVDPKLHKFLAGASERSLIKLPKRSGRRARWLFCFAREYDAVVLLKPDSIRERRDVV
jgi:hypothetical protein